MRKIYHYYGIHNYSFGRKQAADPERNGDAKGKRTKWGLEYERLPGNSLPAGGFDPTQQPRRAGDVEYITIRGSGGMDKVVRRFDSATGKWTYTALGRTFFSIITHRIRGLYPRDLRWHTREWRGV